MDDLISRQAAIEAIWRSVELDNAYEAKLQQIKDIHAIPTADVVEVVRCKDCKYAEVADPEDSQDGYTCQFHRGSIWFSGSYCSWAERRTDG